MTKLIQIQSVLAFCTFVFILEADSILTSSRKFPRCRGRGYFIYVVNNEFQPPFFKLSQKLCWTKNTKLISYMETAVLNEPTMFINFTATFSSPYGYFINSINGVTGRWKEDGTFWCILDKDNKPIPLGVSSYVPERRGVITFNFTNVWPGTTPHV